MGNPDLDRWEANPKRFGTGGEEFHMNPRLRRSFSLQGRKLGTEAWVSTLQRAGVLRCEIEILDDYMIPRGCLARCLLA